MAVQRGFGVAGALDPGVVAELALEAEKAGYTTFWANDTPTGDGLVALKAAAGATTTIQLGVGVIPIDRKRPPEVIKELGELGLPQSRLILGIGAGALRQGARQAVREAALGLRERTDAKVVVGALGPRMCEVGGEAADGVLLNWLTPEYLPELARVTRDAARNAGRSNPWIGAYVRVALAGAAEERLKEEAARYESYPQYAAHFKRMGVHAIQTCVKGTPRQIERGLSAFSRDVDEVVVRAIAAEETLDAYLDVLRAGAPIGDQL